MVGTRAKWFRPPGAKPVYEPQRPPRERRAPSGDERKRYPLPGSKPGDPRRAVPEPLPGPRKPGHGDPRFPGYNPDHYRGVKEYPARPVTRRLRLPKLRIPAIGALDMLDNMISYNPDPGLPPRLPYNYQWCNGPAGWSQFYRWDRQFTSEGGPKFVTFGSCGIGSIDGQSPAGIMPKNQGIITQSARCYYWWDYLVVNPWWPAEYRGATVGAIERIGDPLATPAMPYPMVVNHGSMGNPNHQRWMPTYRDPWAPPHTPPVMEPGQGEPLKQPEAFKNTDLAYGLDYQWGFVVQPGTPQTQPVLQPIGPGAPPVKPAEPPIQPVKRRRPGRGEKQRKVLTKAKKIGIALYKALDAASEAAEVVDAIYEALPDDVKKRWKRADRMGDSFGQYGASGADWKLQALYYNWHKVDVVQAVKNIIKNELQDAVIGRMQQVLPVNTGAAHSQGEKEFAKWLDKELDWFLDQWLEEDYGHNFSWS